jgi:pyridoxamine 5'-phosphate oxidase
VRAPRDPIDELDPSPLVQFQRWFDDAAAAGVRDPDAMTVATATVDGIPSARTLLLRGFDERGFAFYTNLESAKALDLASNPRAALVFHWREVERQVRVSGSVVRVPTAEAEAYWGNRPLGSRLTAWASPQSEVIESRAVLEARVADVQARVGDDPPLPPFWGGYRLVPSQLELWQGRADRLHDRFRYRLVDREWRLERLAP